MSRLGKILLGLSGLSFVLLMVARAVDGEWRPEFWFPLGFTLIFLVGALLKDILFYKELFTMRTTKHGLNLGALVIVVLVALIAVNYIFDVHNKKFDVTEEKLNTISDQSRNVVKNLKSELTIRGFFKSGVPEEEQNKFKFENTVSLYKDESNLVKVQTIDPVKRPDLAKEFKVETSGEVVLSYNGKSSTISDTSEETLTNAIVKLTREKNKTIYYLSGHNERDVASQSPEGAGRFKKALEDSSYTMKPLKLVTEKKVPADADVLLVLGGTQPLFDFEISAIRDYGNSGGRILILADPGQKHNLGQLMKIFGIDFKNIYIVDQVGQMVGASAAMAIGLDYSKTSEITKKFGQQMTAFQLASPLAKAPGNDFIFDELVKSSPASFTKKEIASHVQQEAGDQKGPFVVGLSVSGKLDKSEKGKEFSVVAVGDSDFISNQFLDIQVNRDFALNSVSFLARDTDLLSIRPKMAKGSQLNMTQTMASVVVWGLYLPIPLILFLIGGAVWFKRRGA